VPASEALLRANSEKGRQGCNPRPARPSVTTENDPGEAGAEIRAILTQEVYRGFGPTLASEYLRSKHQVRVGRETLRKTMIEAGLWRARKQTVETVHQWRARRSCRASWCNGTPASTIGWKTGERSYT